MFRFISSLTTVRAWSFQSSISRFGIKEQAINISAMTNTLQHAKSVLLIVRELLNYSTNSVGQNVIIQAIHVNYTSWYGKLSENYAESKK